MLSPSEYDHLTDQISALYARLDQSIVEDMARRIARTGMVTEATRHQAERLQQAGLLYENILTEIARSSDASTAMLRGLFEDAGVQSIRNDNRFYHAAGLEGIVKMSDAALQTLNAGYVKCQGNLQNLTLTTALTTQQAYLDACDLAYMQVSTGTMDYQTAIRRAVQAAAEDGSSVLYPSGHKDQLDVAIRRSVLTGFGQTARQLSLINANDMGCDLMEITAHAGARPSHAEWQGKVVSLSGRKGYLSPSDIGYGTGDGFGGWNCQHDWYPFFEGISERAYTEERLKELNERHIEIDGKLYTDYEVSQMQRALERDIRKQKRVVAGFNAAAEAADSEELAKALRDSFAAASVKLKESEKELQDFLKQTGFLHDSSRVWVNGFGKSVSQKAVWANKKLLQKLDQSDIIDLDNILEKYQKYHQKYPNVSFDVFMVDYKVKQLGIQKGVALPAIPKQAAVLPDPASRRDPYHIMHRMMERGVTDDDLRRFMQEAKIMFVQWNGQRQAFYSERGVVVITKTENGWIYKTAFDQTYFDEETSKIMEVIRKYVEGQ